MATKLNRVLLVEDEALVALFIQECLEAAGYDVVAVAGRLKQAVALARTLELDAAVLDMNLRGEQSDPVAEVLVQRCIPFIVCSGYELGDGPAVMRGVPRLSKPVTAEQLAQALAEAIVLGSEREANGG